ncbi:MAG: hydrogenase maturation nickel metallochaperone HypA [Candidatus Methanosuratus sp.]|nr:hydrogenase maturation nickel metallochaperone HypA [Candidatus Methanosuratincola sp.]
MHEFSLATSLIDYVSEVAKKNGIAKVRELHLEVGDMTHIDPRQLRFCIKIAGQNTVAQGSRVYIKRRSPVLKCLGCGASSKLKRGKSISDYSMTCPACGSEDVELEGGRELLLKRIKGVKKEDPGEKFTS